MLVASVFLYALNWDWNKLYLMYEGYIMSLRHAKVYSGVSRVDLCNQWKKKTLVVFVSQQYESDIKLICSDIAFESFIVSIVQYG